PPTGVRAFCSARTVATDSGCGPETSEVVHSSTSAGDHSHGGALQKSANRRTCEALVVIVCAASIREVCCADQPATISSKNCSAGRSSDTLPDDKTPTPGT